MSSRMHPIMDTDAISMYIKEFFDLLVVAVFCGALDGAVCWDEVPLLLFMESIEVTGVPQ